MNVNWVLFGVEELFALVADCSKLTLSRPLPAGVRGPCSAAVLMACEMIPPVFSLPGSVFVPYVSGTRSQAATKGPL